MVNVAFLFSAPILARVFVDQWLHIVHEDGSYWKIYAAWFE
jgi:cyclohexadienyl dehydratase